LPTIDVSIAVVLSELAFEKGSDLVFESFGVIGPRNLQTLFMASRRLSDLSSDLHSIRVTNNLCKFRGPITPKLSKTRALLAARRSARS
jgi:hypothetical protein